MMIAADGARDRSLRKSQRTGSPDRVEQPSSASALRVALDAPDDALARGSVAAGRSGRADSRTWTCWLSATRPA